MSSLSVRLSHGYMWVCMFRAHGFRGREGERERGTERERESETGRDTHTHIYIYVSVCRHGE